MANRDQPNDDLPIRLPETVNSANATSRELIYYVNIETAKLFAIFIVIISFAYHGFFAIRDGRNSREWLLNLGHAQGYKSWQPYGCMMHEYTQTEAQLCMHYVSYWGERNYFTFLGDSRIRDLYYNFLSHLTTEPLSPTKRHSDMMHRDEKINLKVEFLWAPLVNESMWSIYKNMTKKDRHQLPNYLITGSALWCIRVFNGSRSAFHNFQANLTSILPFVNKLHKSVRLLWILQEPVVEERLSENRSMITNEQIDDYNSAAESILEYSPVTIWRSGRLVSSAFWRESEDGVHQGQTVLDIDSQILLNDYCNAKMNHKDATCCTEREPITYIQIAIFGFFTFSVALCTLVKLYRRQQKKNLVRRAESGLHSRTPSSTGPVEIQESFIERTDNILTALARLGLIMAYMFVCDRTLLFMKRNKYFTPMSFLLPVCYIAVLGLFFTDKSKKFEVLHREQTDEWKGWMQIAILIYHHSGASKVIPIYMVIRVLIASYLFLTGYGHFSYYWKTGDFSLHRVMQVLFRTNFLVIVMCFVMNRPYIFYYFVPLFSFYFLVVYVVMVIWPQVTSSSAESNSVHHMYLLIKLIVAGTIITLLYLSDPIFDRIFLTQPLKALFAFPDGTVKEWRFRWALDRYSVICGIGYGLFYTLLKGASNKVFKESEANSWLFAKSVSILLTFASLLGLLSYIVFAVACSSKPACNEVHSYISIIPVLSFIILRNIHGWLRSNYSSFFAYFGRLSLETFILQYHLWLAADTSGILVLLPRYPVLNVMVTSFIFICIAHEAHQITGTLSRYLVPNDFRLILRNLLLFFALLIPVCISHGVLVL